MDDLSAIEAHYRRSAFIAEICVFARACPDAVSGTRMHAVVVPDMERLRAKRIVNVGDLLRFEMEGLAADLPLQSRVVEYEISFEALPRTTAGGLARDEILRRAQTLQAVRDADRPLTAADRDWLANPRVAAAVAVVYGRAPVSRSVAPDANLEIDLGFDSLARVELICELERRVGGTVSPAELHEIFTVRQIAEALGPNVSSARTGATDEVWAALLKEPLPDIDPALESLLDRKGVLVPLVFAAYRVWRCLVRIEVSGLEHVRRDEAFIIAPNHQSYLDPFFVSCVLPYRTFRRLFLLGATEYFETPLVRRLARALNIVPVDPDANLVGAMQAGAFGLTHGKVLMVFPEGERSIDGAVKRFKRGASILSAELGVPIVPVAIRGSFEVWPRNRPIGWRRLGFWNRHCVQIRFGAPMPACATRDYAEQARRLQDTVAQM